MSSRSAVWIRGIVNKIKRMNEQRRSREKTVHAAKERTMTNHSNGEISMTIVFTVTVRMHDQRWQGYFSTSGPSSFSHFTLFSFLHFPFLMCCVEKRQLGRAFDPPKRFFDVLLFSPLGGFFPFLNILFLKPDHPFPAHFFSLLFYFNVLKRN